MPSESRDEWARRVVTLSSGAMTWGGANYTRVERDFMRSAASAARSAVVVIPVLAIANGPRAADLGNRRTEMPDRARWTPAARSGPWIARS